MTGTAASHEPSAQELWDQEIAASADADAAATVTPEATTPAVETKPETAAAPAVQAPPADPYEGLHPVVRRQLEEQAALAERLRKAEGHIGGMHSELKRTKDELAAAKAAAATVREAPTQAAVAAAQGSTAKWDQLKSEFPEWAEALEERLGHSSQPNLESLRAQVRDELTNELAPRIRTELKAEIAAETETRLVNIAHRGWRQTVNTPEFANWLQSQPANVRALADSTVAEDAIELLDSYKSQHATAADTQRIKDSRKKRLADAASVARGNASMTPTRSTDDMTDAQYWDYLAKNPGALNRR